MRDNSTALLNELDALGDRLAAVLGRVRAFRADLAAQLAADDVRLDVAALQRLAEETDRLAATGEALAGDAATLVGRSRL